MGYISNKDRVKDVKGILAKNNIYKVKIFIYLLKDFCGFKLII